MSDSFCGDRPYEQVAELTCSSGRLFIDSVSGVRSGDGITIDVTPGSHWALETHWFDGVTGLRVRRLDAHQDITQIKLSRGPCFGTCPFFDLTVRRDGKASWHGHRFVDPVGEYTGTITPPAFDRVARAVIQEGFDDWPSRLASAPVDDAPVHELAVARGRANRRVAQSYPYQPPGFERIATEIERIAGRLGWLPHDARG